MAEKYHMIEYIHEDPEALQRTLQDKGLAPAKIYGFTPNAPQPWYRPDLQSDPGALQASWNDYLDGVNMGTYRGGILGAAVGAAALLAVLYFGGMLSSPKAEAKASAPNPSKGVFATATSRHRTSRKGRGR